MKWKWTDWRFLIIVLIILGIVVRFVNLDRKVYWGDEIISSTRSAGYRKAEVNQQLFNGQIYSPQEFQRYQTINPDRSLSDTLHSLAFEAPEHSPLYFTMGRFWQQMFGDSLFVRRSLPATVSLLAIPAVYWLCVELFASTATAWIAAGMLAVSPLQILYAQEVRAYSLWTVLILVSSAALLSAIRRKTKLSWGIYAVSLSLAFYTYMFSALVAIAQGIYVLYTEGLRLTKTVQSYLLASLAAAIIFLPWGLIVARNFFNIQDSMHWTGRKAKNIYVIRLWILNLMSNFVELRNPADPFKFKWLVDLPLAYFIILISPIIGYAIYWLCRRTKQRTWTFILILIATTVLPLLLPDIIFGGQRTSIARYLIPLYLSIQLTIAYLFASKLTDRGIKTSQKQFWQVVTVILVSGSIFSGVAIAQSPTAWTKYADYYNAEIAEVINQKPRPLLIGDGNLNTTQSRLISLSYALKPEARIQGVFPLNIPDFSPEFSDIFVLTVRRREPLIPILMQTGNYQVELFRTWEMSYKRRIIKLWKLTPLVDENPQAVN